MEDAGEWEDSATVFAAEEEDDFLELIAGELPLEDEEEEDDVDPYYFIVPQQTPKGNIYQASRVGDVERIRRVLEAIQIDSLNPCAVWALASALLAICHFPIPMFACALVLLSCLVGTSYIMWLFSLPSLPC